MPPRKKAVLITGCSADGVGATLAYTLAEQGHHVYATARNTAKIPPAVRELDNVTTLQLDVASAASITAASKAVREAGRGLDVLVNNAGEEVTAPLLDLAIGEGSASRDVFEVNVWGPLRLVQTFADLLVESRGRVVNMTSVDVELCPPWIGMYTASKAALNAFSETLRLEMMPLGVGVVLIKIGTIATKHHTGGPSPVLPEGSYYTSILDYITRWATGVAGPERGSVQDFVNDIVHDVVGERKTKTGIVWRGAHSGACWFATRFLPTYIVDRLVTKDHGIEELTHNRIISKSE
ncbi:hypothetical protein K4F52_000082 [Lecanicillium sp. MT-2017a]|nr:hypothetical protein K4F52_000082 [Lecanicillium sp. MT-2017a]